MFPWNIAKSAEAVVFRFALKKVFQFILKKKLGQFILGDIDLDQLDVQLSAGTVQLTDIALNVDYLNDKLRGSVAVEVREGSIASLFVKFNMPWNDKSCQVEVDELELVLAPRGEDRVDRRAETCDSSRDVHVSSHLDDLDVVDKSTTSSLVDVHEGVKEVAKMVKWLLTSFHVRIKKMIVALDPHLQQNEEKMESYETLVLRIMEIECGTCIHEDVTGARFENFLGVNQLTNFLKFQGALLELLHMKAAESEIPVRSAGFPSNTTIPIFTGKKGGFSGTLKISIPWKDGSFDIHKVDADVCLDPLEVRLQPKIINWFLILWKTLKNYEKTDNADCTSDPTNLTSEKDGHATENFVHSNSASYYHPSSSGSKVMLNDKKKPKCRGFSATSRSRLRDSAVTNVLLKDSHLISDWVPISIGKSQRDGVEEADLGASVDQFFECFDGMRSSQSLLGSSGMWNWTCSVFSAITAASNLASGSLHIPPGQRHVETNIKFTLTGVLATFSFLDDDQIVTYCPTNNQNNVDSNVHYLRSRWEDVLILLQVSPQDWKLEATAKHVDINDYFSGRDDAMNFKLDNCNRSVNYQTLMIRNLQHEVESALPSSFLSPDYFYSEVPDISAEEIPSGMSSHKDHESWIECEEKDVVEARLFKTSGVSHLQFSVSSISSDGCFKGPASFSLELPPFIFWVNLNLLNMLLGLIEETGSSLIINNAGNKFRSESSEKHDPLVHADTKGSLQGNIHVPNARVILCFPFNNGGDYGSYTSWDQFIALDFSPAPNFMEEARETAFIQESNLWRGSSSSSHSLHLNVAKVDMYLIAMTSKDGDLVSSPGLSCGRLSTERVFSLIPAAGCPSVISMLWLRNAVTGPWVVKTAKLFATSGDLQSEPKSVTKDYEFASVTTRKDMEDLNSQMQKDMILSSEFLLHVSLCPVVVTLGSSEFTGLCHLLNQVVGVFTCAAGESAHESIETSVGQKSILVECDSVELIVNLDAVDCTKSSLQRELPGSWLKLRLNIQNFELLSVSNLGGISGAIFSWITHGEGRLLGSLTRDPDQELLLIDCSNNAMGRGDGEGSNQLACRPAGSDIVHLYDPESVHSYTQVTVRCGTIVAPGGRLDWLDSMCSFFSSPSPETQQASGPTLLNGNSRDTALAGAFFVLNLIDGSLSYQPHTRKLKVNLEGSKFNSASVEQETFEECVASLLAASSLRLSNTKAGGTVDYDYNIRMQDLGLLLHSVSKPENMSDYSAEYLCNMGYVKVAEEALVEATLTINCENVLHWELSCSQSHIFLSTCHDTTLGLIQLASQIQQLFAPDVEESVVHLQNRWNNVQQEQGRNHCKGLSSTNNNYSSTVPKVKQVGTGAQSEAGGSGLISEICEFEFHYGGNCSGQLDFCESVGNFSDHERQNEEGSNSNIEDLENFPDTCGGSFQVNGLDGHQTSVLKKAEFIEGYCLSELRSLSELRLNIPTPDKMPKLKSVDVGSQDFWRGHGVWYGNTSLKIVENHISDTIDQTGSGQLAECILPSGTRTKYSDSERFKGRVLLKNVNVKWRMYAGSDWHELSQSAKHSENICGRDGTVCLELELSDLDFQYDIFPDGCLCVSRLYLSVKDFYLFDKSRCAPWELVLGPYHSKKHPRGSSSNALKLELEAIRPDPSTPLEEYRLRIALVPLVLHLHQSQLDFLVAFFGGKFPSVNNSDPSSIISSGSKDFEGNFIVEEALLPYFQKFDMWPIILRVDYQPSRVDLAALSGGKYVELVNLVPWKGVELQLKHVQAAGVYGWNSVCETIIGEWLEDISQNQVHKLLQGLPTIRSLVSVGSGAAKLVSLPVKNYRNEHRLLKGLQRGTVAFLRSISVEALGLGVHLAAGAHDVLLHAESILTRFQPLPWPVVGEINSNVGSDQPRDAQQGFQQAYVSLTDGLGKTTSALLHTPIKTYQRGGGAGSALVSAVRGAPAAAIAPASAAAQALQCAFLGVRNSLDAEQESTNKYFSPHSQEQG
ncbi:hypothetical protein Ancab_018170 [Ancistrocladus abbreviatus]